MVNVTYTNDIPLATNNPSQDQPDMKINTNAVDTILNVDHVSFNTNDGGTHKQCQLTSLNSTNGSIPSTFTPTNFFETIYASLSSGVGDLWLLRGSSATGIQLTGGQGAEIIPAAITNGNTFLAGGIQLIWGTVTGISNTAQHVSDITTFSPSFNNACLAVFLTPIVQSTSSSSIPSLTLYNFSRTAFTWVFNKPTANAYTSFNWVAIGY